MKTFSILFLALFIFIPLGVYAAHMTRNTSDRGRIVISHSESDLIEAERAAEIQKKIVRKAQASQRIIDRQRALDKLRALGLSPAEVDALFN